VNTAEQIVRIGLYIAGSLIAGEGFADGEIYQQGIGAAATLGGLAWWAYREHRTKKGKRGR